MNTATGHTCPPGPGPCANPPCPLDDAIGPQAPTLREALRQTIARRRRHTAARIAEAGRMARGARAQAIR